MMKVKFPIARATFVRSLAIGLLPNIFISGALLSEARAAAPTIVNGTFEDQPTVGWGRGQYSAKREWWWNSQECLSVAEISRHDRHTGKSSLHVINLSARAPNVYGTTQQPLATEPHERYRVSLWAKSIQSQSSGGVSIVVDQAWRVRPIQLPKGTYDWKEFHGDFVLSEGPAQLRILCEDLAEVWIDDIEIVPIKTEFH